MLSKYIGQLIGYGLQTGLLPEEEIVYAANLLLDVFREDELDSSCLPSAGGSAGAVDPAAAAQDGASTKGDAYADEQAGASTKGDASAAAQDGALAKDGAPPDLEAILHSLLEEAVKRGLIGDTITERDLFDTRLMNCLLPRPAQVCRDFAEKYAQSPQTATDWYYKFSADSDYIRRYRIKKDMRWKADSPYGQLDLSINLSKPEKDPKAIAAARNAPSSGYPLCLLCRENEGYAGRLNHPARQNHRIIPLTLSGNPWWLQYSPYVYYNEHCIVFNNEHIPMKIDRGTFVRLFDFIDLFPHYILGSNADLPIVGGSILSHDHFQGGSYTFAMEKAPLEETFTFSDYPSVSAGIVKWPMSVLRLSGEDRGPLTDLADHILQSWRGYTDADAYIYAETDGEPHNTITPIARRRDGRYELDLVLRNNITSEEHPLGVYHPHEKLHHIKKENIGLIEVMGLAVLPARLQKEMQTLKGYLLQCGDTAALIRADADVSKHADWVEEFLPRVGPIQIENVDAILRQEIGRVYLEVLEDAGVYKCTPQGRAAFRRFLDTCNL